MYFCSFCWDMHASRLNRRPSASWCSCNNSPTLLETSPAYQVHLEMSLLVWSLQTLMKGKKRRCPHVWYQSPTFIGSKRKSDKNLLARWKLCVWASQTNYWIILLIEIGILQNRLLGLQRTTKFDIKPFSCIPWDKRRGLLEQEVALACSTRTLISCLNRQVSNSSTWHPRMNLLLQFLSLRRTRPDEEFLLGNTRTCRQFSSLLFNSGWPGAQLRLPERGEKSALEHHPHNPLHPCTPPVQ